MDTTGPGGDEDASSTTSSSSSDSNSHGYNLRSRSNSSQERQGVRINWAISNGLATLYSILTQAGEISFGNSDSDDDDFLPTASRLQRRSASKKIPSPDPEQVAALQESDFAQDTNLSLGRDLRQSHRFDVQHNALNVIQNRELGDVHGHRFGHFTLGAKRQIQSTLLPNQSKTAASLNQKVFCGTYSKCGDLFMSACQDQNIRLYDTASGKFKFQRAIRARNVGWSVLDVALSPDNCHLIYSSWCDASKSFALIFT